MSKNIARKIFFAAAVLLVLFVEFMWERGVREAYENGQTEAEYALEEVARLSGWEIPLILIVLFTIFSAVYKMITRRWPWQLKKNHLTDPEPLQG